MVESKNQNTKWISIYVGLCMCVAVAVLMSLCQHFIIFILFSTRFMCGQHLHAFTTSSKKER